MRAKKEVSGDYNSRMTALKNAIGDYQKDYQPKQATPILQSPFQTVRRMAGELGNGIVSGVKSIGTPKEKSIVQQAAKKATPMHTKITNIHETKPIFPKDSPKVTSNPGEKTNK